MAAASTQRRKATNKNSVLEEKITKFYEELEKRGYAGSRQQLCLTNVPRVNIAKSVCRAINKAPAHILQKCKMKVTFDSEEGLDFSGPLREMFYLVSKETFDPYRGYRVVFLKCHDLRSFLGQNMKFQVFFGLKS